MKILLVSELIPYPMLGGLARHCITLGNYYLRTGHDVSLMGNMELAVPENIDKIGFGGKFIPGFRLNQKLADRLQRHIGLYPYQLHRHFAGLIGKAINKAAKNYDVIHYHGHYPIVANYIDSSINFVQTRHDHGTFCLNKLFFRDLTNTVCRFFGPADCAKCFNKRKGFLQYIVTKRGCREWRRRTIKAISGHKTIFVSNRILNIALRGLGIEKPDSAYVVHNFIDPVDITAKICDFDLKRAQLDGNKKGILLASTLDPAKGVLTFLRTLRKRNICHPVTVIGAGGELPELHREFGDNMVSFLGWQPHKEVLRQMAMHKAFILSSLLEEPCATTVLEAMFLKRPVFALRRGGIMELTDYSRHKNQVNLYDSMDELACGIEELYAKRSDNENTYELNSDFGACISNKSLEIIKVYNF